MRSSAAALQRLKDPRVPGALLGLLVLAFGCTPSMPRYPMGGVQNGLDEDIAIRGNARGASFDASAPARSAWGPVGAAARGRGERSARRARIRAVHGSISRGASAFATGGAIRGRGADPNERGEDAA